MKPWPNAPQSQALPAL